MHYSASLQMLVMRQASLTTIWSTRLSTSSNLTAHGVMQEGEDKQEAGVWKTVDRAGKAEGRRRLREALSGHKSWNPAEASRVLRFTDQLDVSGKTAPQASLFFITAHKTSRISCTAAES